MKKIIIKIYLLNMKNIISLLFLITLFCKIKCMSDDKHTEKRCKTNSPSTTNFTIISTQDLSILSIINSFIVGHNKLALNFIKSLNIDPWQPDKGGLTTVETAVCSGSIDIVKYFTENEAFDINRTSEDGSTILHMAASFGQLNVLKYLIEEKNMDPLLKDRTKLNVLYAAVFSERIDIVRYLIGERNMDPLLKDKQGFTALHIAIISGKLNIIKYLIGEKKVGIRCRIDGGVNTLQMAKLNNRTEIFEYIHTKIFEQAIKDEEKCGICWTPITEDNKNQFKILESCCLNILCEDCSRTQHQQSNICPFCRSQF